MSDLSELVPARLASMEAQLAGILALLNGRFQVVYIGRPCVVVPPLGVVPPGFGGVHELSEATCREGITATQTGSVIKETAAPDGDHFGRPVSPCGNYHFQSSSCVPTKYRT